MSSLLGSGRRSIPVVITMLLLGCAAEQTTPAVSTPSASGAAPAPVAPTSASAPGTFDGLYVGTAVSMRPGSVNCPPELTLKNFKVENNEVRFGGFRGAIQRDGSVRIPNRNVWLTGRFSGTQFRGEFTQFGGRGRSRTAASDHAERCIYATALRREAS